MENILNIKNKRRNCKKNKIEATIVKTKIALQVFIVQSIPQEMLIIRKSGHLRTCINHTHIYTDIQNNNYAQQELMPGNTD